MSPLPNQPTLFILAGIPFSGKTTLGKKLQQATNGEYLRLNAIVRELTAGSDGERVWQHTYDQAHDIALEQIKQSLSGGVSVIYDTAPYRRTRVRLAAMARACGAEALTIFLDTPKEETFRRYIRNLATQQRHSHHPELLLEVTENFEPPDRTEHHLVVRPGDDQAAWIARHIQAVVTA